MEIPESNYNLYALYLCADVRDRAEVAFLKELKEAVRIADNMRDTWKHQRCGAE